MGSVLHADFNTLAALWSNCPALFELLAQKIPISPSSWLYTMIHLVSMTVGEKGRDGGAV